MKGNYQANPPKDQVAQMLIQRLLRRGKRNLAQRIFDRTMEKIQTSTGSDPQDVLHQAIQNVTPKTEVKSKRVRGSTYQVPKEVSSERGLTLGLRWLLQAAKQRPERGMIRQLTAELIAASDGRGNAIRKRDEIHRMAEANRAYAHLK